MLDKTITIEVNPVRRAETDYTKEWTTSYYKYEVIESRFSINQTA
jgi:hypothetical protein